MGYPSRYHRPFQNVERRARRGRPILIALATVVNQENRIFVARSHLAASSSYLLFV